jgi:hypothetical protein
MRQYENGEICYTYASIDLLPKEFESASRWIPNENVYNLE